MQGPGAGGWKPKVQGSISPEEYSLRRVFSSELGLSVAHVLEDCPPHLASFPQPPPTQTSKLDSGKTKQNPYLRRSFCMGEGEREECGPSSATELAPMPCCCLGLVGWQSSHSQSTLPPGCPEMRRGSGVWKASLYPSFLAPHHAIPSPYAQEAADARLQSYQRQNKQESIRPRVSSAGHFLK